MILSSLQLQLQPQYKRIWGLRSGIANKILTSLTVLFGILPNKNIHNLIQRQFK
jgi:hypothetical protein